MKKVLLLAIVASLSVSSTAHAGKWGKLADRVTNTEQEIDALQEYTNTLIPAIQDTLYDEGIIRANSDKKLMNSIAANRESIFTNTQNIAANTAKINELESSMSMFSAMANLTDDQLSVAVGHYNGYTSLAMGSTFQVKKVNIKVSGSTDFDNFTVGGGVGFNFK